MARLLLVLLLTAQVVHCGVARADAPTVRVILDPALDAGPDRVQLGDETRRCLAELRALLQRPATRVHFLKHYGLNPLRILERDDFAVIVRPFPKSPRSEVVGAYVFGDTTLDLNVAVLRSARRAADPAPWRRYVAGVLVHELAHLADYLDDGINDDGGLVDAEEGVAAQVASGCELTPPGELVDEAPLALTRDFWSPGRQAPRVLTEPQR